MEYDLDQWQRLIRETEQNRERLNRLQIAEAAIAGGGALIGGLGYGVMSNLRHSSKRTAAPSTDQPSKYMRVSDDEDMTDTEGPGVMALAAPSGGEKATAKETPIANVSPTYGLQDTHTTILPITIYFTPAGFDGLSSTAVVTLNMTGIYDPATEITWKSPLTTTGPTEVGIYPNSFVALGTNAISAYPRDCSVSNASAPAWRSYWDAIYAYYTVTACHWELTVINACDGFGFADVQVSWMYHGNTVPPSTSTDAMRYWKNMNYRIVKNGQVNNSGGVEVITGSYYPGQFRREVRDDTETKTWIAKGANPSLKENLRIMFNQGFNGANSTANTACNCMLTLKYVVQWKDLVQSLKYPVAGSPLPGQPVT